MHPNAFILLANAKLITKAGLIDVAHSAAHTLSLAATVPDAVLVVNVTPILLSRLAIDTVEWIFTIRAAVASLDIEVATLEGDGRLSSTAGALARTAVQSPAGCVRPGAADASARLAGAAAA